MRVLLLTNDLNLDSGKDMSNLETFLEASPYVDYEKVEPPNIVDMEFDVVIIKDVKPDLMISKIRDDINDYLEKGGSVIISGQDNLGSIGIDEILPVIPEGQSFEEGEVEPLEHEILTDLTFSKIKGYENVKNKESAIAIADVVSGESRTALISYMSYGKGRIMYYGIPEKNNEFKLSASYPIIWNRALRFVSEFNNFDSMNKKTDEEGYAEVIGFNNEGNKDVAVNLLDEKESDTTMVDVDRIEKETGNDDSSFVTMQEDLMIYLIPFVLLLIFFEIYYIKRRGDI
jgi:hypothetical protein